MPKQVVSKGPDEHYSETEDGNLVKISTEEAKVLTGFNNVEEIQLSGQVIGGGQYFESDRGTISKIIPADN